MGDLTAALCSLLTRAYLAGVPTTRALWTHVSYALDAAKDELSPQDLVGHVLKACVQHPLNSEAPRDPRHFLEVWKWLADAWQQRGWPIPEIMCSSEMEEEPANYPELCYKTYVGWGNGNKASTSAFSDSQENPKGVTLLESSGGIVHHTTGLTTWGGAAMLANWVTDYPYFISGKRVLELGAGVGFTASVILTTPSEGHRPPVSYIATDCHHHVLTLLHHNLELNLRQEPMEREELEAFQEATGRLLVTEEVQAGQIRPWHPPYRSLRLSTRSPDLTDDAPFTLEDKTPRETDVQVLQVDWRNPGRLPDVDVVLAADVVYAHHLIPPLVSLIKSILDGTASKSSRSKEGTNKSQKINLKEYSSNIETVPLEPDARRRLVPTSNGIVRNEIEGEREENRDETEREREKYEERETSQNNNESGEESSVDGDALERVAYIACTRRSHETMGVFLEEVSKQGLAHSLVYQATLDTDTFLFLYNETHVPVRIYKLSLRNSPPY